MWIGRLCRLLHLGFSEFRPRTDLDTDFRIIGWPVDSQPLALPVSSFGLAGHPILRECGHHRATRA